MVISFVRTVPKCVRPFSPQPSPTREQSESYFWLSKGVEHAIYYCLRKFDKCSMSGTRITCPTPTHVPGPVLVLLVVVGPLRHNRASAMSSGPFCAPRASETFVVCSVAGGWESLETSAMSVVPNKSDNIAVRGDTLINTRCWGKASTWRRLREFTII